MKITDGQTSTKNRKPIDFSKLAASLTHWWIILSITFSNVITSVLVDNEYGSFLLHKSSNIISPEMIFYKYNIIFIF